MPMPRGGQMSAIKRRSKTFNNWIGFERGLWLHQIGHCKWALTYSFMLLKTLPKKDAGDMTHSKSPLSMVGNHPMLDRVKDDLDSCAIAAIDLPDSLEFEKIYIFAAIRRTLSLIVAFRQSIEVGNEQMAATILRLNLDTVARFYALFWADETDNLGAEEFAKLVFEGSQINKMKLRNQKDKATDSWLISQIETLEPWIKDVYQTTSGAIHFSDFHMNMVLRQIESYTPHEGGGVKVRLVLGGTEKINSPNQYNILKQAFTHICLLLVCAMKDRCGLLERSPSGTQHERDS